MKTKLNARQDAFVDAFTNPKSKGFGNATQAAIVAGYSKRTAGQHGCRLLKDVKIQAAIVRRRATAAEKAEFTRLEAVRLALEQANAWKDDAGLPLLEPLVNNGEVVRVDGEIVYRRWRPDGASKGALELAAKIAGHIVDKFEHSGPGGGPIQVQDIQDLDDIPDEELEELETAVRRLHAARNGRD